MLALENYIKECSNSQAAIFGYLREIILSCSKEIEEYMSGNTPHYHFNGGVCYINNQSNGACLAFCNGNDLYDPNGVLEPGEKYDEKHMHFNSMRDINPDIVLPIVQQAIRMNKVNAERVVAC